MTMKKTEYFENDVEKRPERFEARRPDWIAYVLAKPAWTEVEENGRIRHWRYILEIRQWLRVVTLADNETVHNVFLDRGFRLSRKRSRQTS